MPLLFGTEVQAHGLEREAGMVIVYLLEARINVLEFAGSFELFYIIPAPAITTPECSSPFFNLAALPPAVHCANVLTDSNFVTSPYG